VCLPLQARLQDERSLQHKAVELLLSGANMPPKKYPPTNWAPPGDTPRKFAAADTQYAGPYPMSVIQAGWYGHESAGTKCPDNFPVGAPRDICGHLALIENDSQMAYRQAMAYVVTGNASYASNAFSIIDSWAEVSSGRCTSVGAWPWVCGQQQPCLQLDLRMPCVCCPRLTHRRTRKWDCSTRTVPWRLVSCVCVCVCACVSACVGSNDSHERRCLHGPVESLRLAPLDSHCTVCMCRLGRCSHGQGAGAAEGCARLAGVWVGGSCLLAGPCQAGACSRPGVC
jgi:hypothetical protein